MKKFFIFVILILGSIGLQAGMISGYTNATYIDAKTLKAKLQKNGFEVLAQYHPAGKSNLDVLLFTSADLKKVASKKTRGFAAVQRVLINQKNKIVLVGNPHYWLKAFLQDDYDNGVANRVNASLAKVFGAMTSTSDGLKESDLSSYHFMFGMPYYEDMITLKKGVSGTNVTNKLFSLDLPNGSTIIGVKMDQTTEQFIDTIGEDKALVLPYMVLVEDGNAFALHAKYYLAISYPLLSMGQFMKISATPGKIEETLKALIK